MLLGRRAANSHTLKKLVGQSSQQPHSKEIGRAEQPTVTLSHSKEIGRAEQPTVTL